MKFLAITLAALVLVAGAAVPVALAQQDASSPPQAPQQKAPDVKVDVDVKTGTDRSDDAAGSASPASSV